MDPHRRHRRRGRCQTFAAVAQYEIKAMERSFSTRTTGGLFVAGGAMLWFGWYLMPVRIGTFFDPADFSAVNEHLLLWIWLFRVHIFGYIVVAMALVAVAALFAAKPARILIWPGAAVASAGLLVSTLAAAFYYHFGAWGAVAMEGESAEVLRQHVDSLWVATEYVTCLVRFGRVFLGFGLLILGIGITKWKLLPRWIGWSAAGLGLAAMVLTMTFPDDLEFYTPVFHLTAAWLAATGISLLRSGACFEDDRVGQPKADVRQISA